MSRRPAPARVEVDERRRVHQGFLALDLLRLRHERFDGAMTPFLRRELLVQRPAVAVLPWDPDTDTVVLVEQFRSGMIDEPCPWSLEAVAGLLDEGEPAERAARREVLEETGLELGRLADAGRYHSSPGATTEMVRCFVGEVAAAPAAGMFGVAAEHEDIRTMALPLTSAAARLDDGTITAANTVVPLSWLLRHRDRLRASWLAGEAGAV